MLLLVFHITNRTMKLAVTSDLHLPITPIETIVQLAREMAEWGPDVVAVAGDVAESVADLTHCLTTLKESLSCPVLVVVGNHDLWARGCSSMRLWEEVLPQTVALTGCVWLEGKAHVQAGVAVVGSVAWYDYSAVDRELSTTPEILAQDKRYFNMDAQMIDWRWTDPEFAARVAQPLLARLDLLESDAAVRQTVVVTHVPLLECQMCRRPDNPGWGFSNAYFGNLTLGEQVLARRKVTHIVSGHTHIPRSGMARRKDGSIVQAQVLASDYRRPAWVGLNLTAVR